MHAEFERKGNGKSHHLKLIIFLIFLGILGFLVVPSIYPVKSITGKFISPFSQQNGTVKFAADLTIPELVLKGKFQDLEFKGNSNSYFYVENEKLRFHSNANYVAMDEYNGEISFNDKTISKLKGKVSKVSLNGLPVESKTMDLMKVSLEDEFNYDYLLIRNEVEIPKLNYNSTGTININNGENILRFQNKEIEIKNFNGNVKVQGSKLNLEGYASTVEIKSGFTVSVSGS
ncbi:hypothetical protein HY449_02125 [Candidatus Pacearchaeota archaeon]|nr:hypothetical protein [Candidatus Pacearchaeota archaeon]